MNDRDPYDVSPGHRSGFVAVVGRPNVGKSTLVNGILGHKIAIVSSKIQTTRSRILGILTRDDAQVILIDTPGLHRPRHALGEALVAVATQSIPDADVVMLVVDASQPPGAQERQIVELIRQRTRAPLLLVLNKMDLLPPEHVRPHTEAYWEIAPDHADWIMTIATQGVNLDELVDKLVALLREGPRYYPDTEITDQTERTIAAELIREQALHLTHQEVPHAVAVVVEEFKERENGVVYIAATIHVERDSQKGIVIGRGGQMLQRIGSAARQEIERMVGGRVYLELWVKVSENWRRDPKQIERMGYGV